MGKVLIEQKLQCMQNKPSAPIDRHMARVKPLDTSSGHVWSGLITMASLTQVHCWDGNHYSGCPHMQFYTRPLNQSKRGQHVM